VARSFAFLTQVADADQSPTDLLDIPTGTNGFSGSCQEHGFGSVELDRELAGSLSEFGRMCGKHRLNGSFE